MGPLPTSCSPETCAKAIACGGLPQQAFRNNIDPEACLIVVSRAPLRQQIVEAAKERSDYFRTVWCPTGRPRVTSAFRAHCQWVRAPFVLSESLPPVTDESQVRLAGWETCLRGVEEHLMLAIFGEVPNVTWARFIARVFER